MKKLHLVIAGTSIAIEMEEAVTFFLPHLQDSFRGFLRQRDKSTVQVALSYDPRVMFRKFKAFPTRLSPKDDAETIRLLNRCEQLHPISSDTLLIGFLNGVLAYDADSQKGHISLFRSHGKNFLLGSLQKLLFLCTALALTEQNKLVVHGAGLRVLSDGWLFLGASGAGKTTVAGCVEREDVFSDDATVITHDERVFKIHASPFSQINLFDKKGARHYRKEAPLTKLVFLNQASYTDLKQRDKRSALAELLRHSVHGLDIMDRDLKATVFDFCCELSESVPAFDLYFQKNDRFLFLLKRQDLFPGCNPVNERASSR